MTEPTQYQLLLEGKITQEQYEAHLKRLNDAYDAYFFSPEAKRQYDDMMDAYAPSWFEMYADPESPRGQRLRTKHAREKQAKPRQGARRLRILSGQLTPAQRFAIFKRDGYTCRLCGASQITDRTTQLHVDHITPRSKGGMNDPSNLWTLCALCNRGKGTQSL